MSLGYQVAKMHRLALSIRLKHEQILDDVDELVEVAALIDEMYLEEKEKEE